jgi:hypothetical protein
MYHIISRGDQRDDIFFADVERYDFLKSLAKACEKTRKPTGKSKGSRRGREGAVPHDSSFICPIDLQTSNR